MQTLKSVLDKTRGVGPGFDALRITLAVSVVCWHSPAVLYGGGEAATAMNQSVLWFPGYAILVMFFGLSGFLITGSAQRLKLRDFLINRSLRIVPALTLDVIIWALILGPVFSNLTTAEYFHSPLVYKYFTNIVGLINFRLPGVFYGNPDPTVNESLWTVTYEIGCYLIMTGLIFFRLLNRPAMIALAAVIVVSVGIALWAAGLGSETPSTLVLHALNDLFFRKGSRLFVAFLLGIAAYLWRDKVPFDRRIFLACIVLCAVFAVAGPTSWMNLPVLNGLLAAPLIYITVFLGLSKIPTPVFLRRGDYSYGIYLYGYPVQQAMVATFPRVTSIWLQTPMSLVCIFLFAMFSWHAVERPILQLRRRFSFVARERLAGEAGRASEKPVLSAGPLVEERRSPAGPG